MSVKSPHTEFQSFYFCTFTCTRWMNLISMTNAYEKVYQFFELMNKKKNYITGFVVMPNHVHFIIYLNEEKKLNTIIGNGKRFLSYEVVEQLKKKNDLKTLSILQTEVTASDRQRGKLHQPFKHSFDAKQILNKEMMLEKLRYIHHNPVSKKWNLVGDYLYYPHSSALFYEQGINKFEWLKNFYDVLDGKYE